MKQVTLNIPDNKYQFFLELIKNLNFIKIDKGDRSVPEWQKEIVRERTLKSKEDPGRLLNWDDVQDKFTVD